jgi:hypothetical protein
MSNDPYSNEIKAIKLLQDRSAHIDAEQNSIGDEIGDIKRRLSQLNLDFSATSQRADKAQNQPDVPGAFPLDQVALSSIYIEANQTYTAELSISDVIDHQTSNQAQASIDEKISEFNKKNGLDHWDYAIAVSCGLFAAMLDLLFVRAPIKPTASWDTKVNGIFNQWVQLAFNKLIPPELSAQLGALTGIGAPDASTTARLINAPPKALNPTNHRLRSLAHDPVLGFIFGVIDMMKGTCTVVHGGRITSIPGKAGPTEGNVFQLVGRMLGHLASDVNAPSGNGNRGMGLPAPFMGLLRMFENVPLGDSSLGRQIEYMYVKGYDFRQFVATSIPMAIMEVMMRSFYAIKHIKFNNETLPSALLSTLPTQMAPKFRIMLAIAYGTSSAVDAGKIYLTENILNANYASWMGFAWNGFHSLRWALVERHFALWEHVENQAVTEIEEIVASLDSIIGRAENLPI